MTPSTRSKRRALGSCLATAALVAGLTVVPGGAAFARSATKSEYSGILKAVRASKSIKPDKARILSVRVSDLDPAYARVELRTSKRVRKQAIVARTGKSWTVTAYAAGVASRCTGAPLAVIDQLFAPTAACSAPATTTPVTPAPAVTAAPVAAPSIDVKQPDRTLLRERSSADIYVIYGGARFKVSPPMLASGAKTGLSSPNVKVVADGALGVFPVVPRDGTVLRELSSPTTTWIVVGGARFEVASTTILRRIGHETADIRVVADGGLTAIPTTPRDGTFLREWNSVNPAVILGGSPFSLSPADLRATGRRSADATVVPDGSLAALPKTPGDGAVLREPTNTPTFLTAGGAVLGVPSVAALTALGKTLNDPVVVPPGTIAKMAKVPRDGTLLREPSTGVHALIVGGARFVLPPGFGPERIGRQAKDAIAAPDGSVATLPVVPRDGTLLREAASGAVTLIAGGARFALSPASPPELLGRRSADVVTVPDGSLTAISTTPVDNALLRPVSSPQVYLFLSGTRFPVPAGSSLLATRAGEVVVVPDGSLDRFPLALQDGTFVKESGDPGLNVWVMVGGAKFALLQSSMATLGYTDLRIVIVPAGYLTGVPTIPRDRTVVRELGRAEMYLVAGGARFLVPSVAVLSALGLPTTAIRTIPQGGLAQIPTVPRDGAQFRELSNPTVYAVQGGKRYVVAPGSLATPVLVPDGALAGIPLA